MRATGVAEITNYRPLFGAMALLGMPPYGHETPDGYANTREAWLNPEAMMTRLSFATALGQGHLPLLALPFETGGGNGPPFRVKFKGRGGGDAMTREIDLRDKGSQRDKGSRIDPPQPTQLIAALGGELSASTREAVEAAPIQLRSALILGSPEFMMR